MNFIQKLLSVLTKNIAVTIILVVAIVLFVYFAADLLPGLIAAFAALLVYTCCGVLYKEYQKMSSPTKKTVKKK
ncbi:MAG: hypothetical protein ACLRFI_00345 [Alphaproteobacteria bacterium]